MKYLLILLLPCLAWAGDAKIRHDGPDYSVKHGDIAKRCAAIDTCAFTVREKCDTLRIEEWYDCHPRRLARAYDTVICKPDTVWKAVDSGWRFTAPDGKMETREPLDEDTLWIFDTPFLRSEMPILREMIAEYKAKMADPHRKVMRCQVCGHCEPSMSGWSCTAMGGDCVNACTAEATCKNDLGASWLVSINECDHIVWDTTATK